MKLNASTILAIGVAVVLIILTVAGYKFLTLPEKGMDKAAEVAVKAMDKCAEVIKAWGQTKVSITSQNDCLEVKPTAELVFAKVRVRSILKYETTVNNSTKVIIGHQAFDIRFGWDLSDSFNVALLSDQKSVQITAHQPKKLNISHVEAQPEILSRADGFLNKLTPEDGFTFSRQLELAAMGSPDMAEARKVAKDNFEKFFTAMFQLQGLGVTFKYTNEVNPITTKLNPG